MADKYAVVVADMIVFKFVEGDGCNLFESDYDEGFVDYIMADICILKNDENGINVEAVDGAQIMCTKLCSKMSMEEFIATGLGFWYEETPKYVVLESNE